MKTMIEINACDECGKRVEPPDQMFTFNISIDAGSVKDLCWSCLKARVRHSFDVMKDAKCKTCSGKGKVKVSVYNNDYEWETCKNCSGKGKVI